MQSPVKSPYQLVHNGTLPEIFSMSSEERLSKQFAVLSKERALRATCEVLIRSDSVFDTPVLRGLLSHTNIAVTDVATGEPYAACVEVALVEQTRTWLAGEGAMPASITVHSPAEIANAYDLNLRKREAPAAHRLTPDNAREVEWKLFMTAYKGVTDFITKFWWPRPAFRVTRWCAAQGISPNQVTAVSAILVLASLFLFMQGFFWLGMLSAWIMTFLDTVDGKLARVTLTSSPIGNIFDHGIDLIHPPFWYWAWAAGLAASDTPLHEGWFTPLMWMMFGGYIVGRLCEGYFSRRYKMHIHVWRRIDSSFRLILARRNPNMLLLQLSLLVARPDWGLLAVVAWTLVCLVLQCIQLAQAEVARMQGGPLSSWLDRA